MLDAKRAIFYVTALTAGVIAATAGIILSSISFKFLLAALAVLVLIAGLCLMPDRAEELLLFGIVFFIPVNVDVNFFLYKHVGTASSIAVSATWILNCFFLLFLIRNRFANEIHFRIGGELIALLCYMLWGVVTLIRAQYPVFVYLELIRLVMLGMIAFSISNISDPRLLRRMVIFLMLALLFQSCLACVQYFVKSFPAIGVIGMGKVSELFPGQKVHRVMGTVGHPNFLGYFLEITLPIAFALILAWPDVFIGQLAMLAWMLGTVALILTKSRGAWVSYPFALGFVFLFGATRNLLRLRSFTNMIIVVAVAISILVFSYPIIKKRFVGRDYKAASVRMPLNKAALSIIKQFPLVGVGLNNFSEVFKKYDKTGYSRIFRGYKHVVHNMYLLIATETGIIGLFLFLLIFFFPFFYTFRSIIAGINDMMVQVMVGICGGFFAHFIHCLVDPGFILTHHVSALMFMLTGLCSACYRMWFCKEP